MQKKLKYLGQKFTVGKSNRKDKQLVATFPDGKKVHFGSPGYPEYPGTKRGNNYCARSYGIGKRDGTLNNIKSPNTLSRFVLWKCKGKKSMKI